MVAGCSCCVHGFLDAAAHLGGVTGPGAFGVRQVRTPAAAVQKASVVAETEVAGLA